MKAVLIVVAVAALGVVRIAISRAKRRRRAARQGAGAAAAAPDASELAARAQKSRWIAVEAALGDVGLVAGREIRERLRGRFFRVGTLIMLLAVGAAVVIPALHKGSTRADAPEGRYRRNAVTRHAGTRLGGGTVEQRQGAVRPRGVGGRCQERSQVRSELRLDHRLPRKSFSTSLRQRAAPRLIRRSLTRLPSTSAS